MNLNQRLLNRMLRHLISIERLKSGAVKRHLPLLQQFDDRLLGAYTRVYNSDNFEMQQFYKQVRELKKQAYEQFLASLTQELSQIAVGEAAFITTMFSSLLTPDLISEPAAAKIERIVNNEIRGETITQHIKSRARNDINQYIVAAKIARVDGLSLNESVETIKALHLKRDNKSDTLIRTMIASVTSDADQVVYKSNQSIIKGIQLSVTFDSRTTPICIRHSDENKLYPAADYPKPPFHYNCRTRAVVITKSWKELGKKDQKKVPESIRQSMDGGTLESNTYSQWLKGQPRQIQEDAIGIQRVEQFRKGNYKLTRFIDPTGKFYTVNEAFKK